MIGPGAATPTGALPRTGELGPDAIRRCFGLPVAPALQLPGLSEVLVGRPPRLCDKCPHTDAYLALNEVVAGLGDGVRVMGDIGCYSLGALEPLGAIQSCLCMGASIGMAIGAAHAGMTPALAVIGDGTFTHSGMAPLLDAVRENVNVKVFILDNAIVATVLRELGLGQVYFLKDALTIRLLIIAYGVWYAAPSQVAADLLTSPGRGPAEGEELIQWMQANEEAWRR